MPVVNLWDVKKMENSISNGKSDAIHRMVKGCYTLLILVQQVD
jgi:hypothetical protein